jgi:choice-of-anchor A domain-containing protein
MHFWNLRRALAVACLLPLAADCSTSPETTEFIGENVEALVTCTAHGLRVVDLHADFRDIWAGRESAEAGKQAEPLAPVVVDFSATVVPSQVIAEFVPVVTDGSCGTAVPATILGSVLPGGVWGSSSSTSGRPVTPRPYDLFVRESISGVVSSGGAIAAGGDITLTSFGVNGTTRQPVGLIAGGKVVLSNGSVQGNLTYGVASTIPGTVTVTGTKTLQSFNVASAFDNLEVLSALLAAQPATGTAQLSSGTLRLTGTTSGANVFQVSAETLSQTSSITITVPTGAGAIVNLTGPNVALENKSLVLQGATATSLLWNVPEAGFVRVSSMGLLGSVFAPGARLTFESASLSGTIVARNFQSPGSGSLNSAPLNVSLLLGSSAPSSVSLRPQQALVRDCTYQFVVPSNQGLTSNGNCLNAELRVGFRVAPSPSTPSTRELANAQLDPVLGTLRRFESRPGVNTLVGDVWSRYASAIGVPRSALVSTGAARQDPTRPSEMLVPYQQYHLGYPVAGFGYLVATENGVFRNAAGKSAANLPTTLPTPVSSATAISAALSFAKITNPPWVANPSKYRAPTATLVLAPQRPNPAAASDYRLVWDVRFLGSGVTQPGSVQIDAGTGAIAGSTPGTNQVSFLATGSTYVTQLNDDRVETAFNGTQPIHPAQYREPSGVLQKTLASGPAGPGRRATLQQPLIAPGGDLFAAIPLEIVDTTPATPWLASEDRVEQLMASAHWGLELAHDYLGSLGFGLAATPWTSVDGAGHQQVLMRFFQPGSGKAQGQFVFRRSDADTAIILLTDGTPAAPVTRFIVPHEFAHVFLWNVRRQFGLGAIELPVRLESGAIGEALADLYAAGAVRRYFGEIADWTCLQEGTVCNRDTANPLRTNQPSYYGDPRYVAAPSSPLLCVEANDFCSVHHNSTVVSHWGYLLAKGSATTPLQNPCELSIDPLNANAEVALRQVINIGTFAAGTRLATAATTAEPTFADFRDQTLAVVQNHVTSQQLPADATRKMELAWYAVGLGPRYLSKPVNSQQLDSRVTPDDDSASVYPWQTFSWPVQGDGMQATSWDFQIADGPSFTTNLRFQEPGITDTFQRNGTTLASVTLALPFNSSTRFYWRVRPHSDDPWQGCYPVHSFVNTTTPETIDSIVSQHGAGMLDPGGNRIQWDAVEGAVRYRVFVSTNDSNCQAGNGVTVFEAPISAVTIHGIQPETHYWVAVQPVGPGDFNDAPSVGGCFKAQFDSAALSAPVPRNPFDTQIFDYHAANSPEFVWTPSGEPASYRLTFFEIDELGACGTTPAPLPQPTVNDSCGWLTGTCGNHPPFKPDLSAYRNPTGYCWTVTQVAANGRTSPPSTPQRFMYLENMVELVAPGKRPPNISFSEPNPLADDSYGKGVAFSWVPEPDAFDYVLKVARWPWKSGWSETTPVRDPFNCVEESQFRLVGHSVLICAPGQSCTTFVPTMQNLGPMDGCDWTPVNGNFVSRNVTGSSATLSANEAGKGRYCWMIFPRVEPPDGSDGLSARQPLVANDVQYCYTTGPAEPVITIAKPPANTYTTATVKGSVRFDYIPDGQADVRGEPAADFKFTYDRCPFLNGAILYNDRYDCTVDFEITPQESTNYTVTARTWSSDQHPPVMNDDSEVHDKNDGFVNGACGARGETCCRDNKCDNAGLVCNGGKCVDCGGNTQPCCQNNTCDPPAGGEPRNTLTCEQGTCRRCGSIGASCCPPPHVSGKGCTSGAVDCRNGKCVACGGMEQACCSDHFDPPSCANPDQFSCVLSSGTAGICQACGRPGQRCCSGTISNGTQQGCINGYNCTGNCTPCGGPGQDCCFVAGDAECREGRCSNGKCPGSGGGDPGGGGVSCAPGFQACGDGICRDVFSTPAGQDPWDEWREDNPTTPIAHCIAGTTWQCDTSLDTAFCPTGMLDCFALNGTAACCPPTLHQIFVTPSGRGLCCPSTATGANDLVGCF